MKLLFLLFLASTVAKAGNENRNLSILMRNGSAKLHSTDIKLHEKLLADEFAESMNQNKKNVTFSNKCERPRIILNEDTNQKTIFEDCSIIIKKSKKQTIMVQYQIRSKIKNGRLKSATLRKGMLKTSYL